MVALTNQPEDFPESGLSLDQIISLVASSDSDTPRETLKHLILQTYLHFPEIRVGDAGEMCQYINDLFSLHVAHHEVETALDQLLKTRGIWASYRNKLGLSIVTQARLRKVLQDAIALQQSVQQKWFNELRTFYTELDKDKMWKALSSYLVQVFRQHSMQAVALLGATTVLPPEQSQKLSELLITTVAKHISQSHRQLAQEALASFLAQLAQDADGASYITQLANASFNYFALNAAPEVAQHLRTKLKNLELFFDTNFLFGILDIHYNPHIRVSRALIKAIIENRFPFRLRYHEATMREMRSTLEHKGNALQQHGNKYNAERSRIIVEQNEYGLSGLELQYHKLNMITPLSVDAYLARFSPLQGLLKAQKIEIHRPSAEITDANIDIDSLLEEYRAFLKRMHRAKPLASMKHDMEVLAEVRRIRKRQQPDALFDKNASLEGGVLLVTCDYSLYKFDWETSQERNEPACTAMPSHLWQVLRPFMGSDQQANRELFDKSFAEALTLPEFRTSPSSDSERDIRVLPFDEGFQNAP